ncbi:MAG: ATP-binding protein [Fibromonadales bacterium]|nr:ATP-binding protein [Fibromonadales bacterium]
MPAKFKKLPYGKSNFADVIEGGFAYVDKTRFIEMLENENNPTQFFVRPRRFGKSLFLSVLENYYDLNRKDKFESIFDNLCIGKNPTQEQGKYAILSFNFSAINTDCEETFKESFKMNVHASVVNFLKKYEDKFENAQQEINWIKEKTLGIDSLRVVYHLAEYSNIPIFAIIDEYDHFSNDLAAMGSEFYGKMVGKAGLVRDFYESLKIATSSVMKRIFITGIAPIMLNDLTSGFNIATDYSLIPKYNEMFGFTSEEVERLIIETGIDKNLIKVDMEAYYNGYLFNEEAEKKVYNSTMVLFLFNQILLRGKQPNDIIDTNLQTDYNRLKKLAENPKNREKLLKIAHEDGIFSKIIEKFSLDQIEDDSYFVSLLFYMGLLTIDKERPLYLKIPNYSIKTLFWQYLVAQANSLVSDSVNADKLLETVRELARGDAVPYLDYISENLFKRISNRDLIHFDEKYIKVMLLSTLFMSSFYLPVSETEVAAGYTDIYLLRHSGFAIKAEFEWVWELKYVKESATEAEIEAKKQEALSQIEKYKKDLRFAGRNDIKFAALVFRGKGDYEVVGC